jgi:L-rhamnose mutarotase
MLTALRNSGWRNYSLFLDDGGMLIGYFETDNLQQALASIAKEEVNLRWQREMAGFFIGLPGARADQGFLRLEQVFYNA